MFLIYIIALLACVVMFLRYMTTENMLGVLMSLVGIMVVFVLGVKEGEKLDKKLPDVTSQTIYFHKKGQSADSVKIIELNSRIICVKYDGNFSCLKK